MSFVICAFNTTKQKDEKTSSGIRTLTDGVTGANLNQGTNYFLSIIVSVNNLL